MVDWCLSSKYGINSFGSFQEKSFTDGRTTDGRTNDRCPSDDRELKQS